MTARRDDPPTPSEPTVPTPSIPNAGRRGRSLALAALLAATPLAGAARADRLALLSVDDRAGDEAVAGALEGAVAEGLSARHEILSLETVRDALRRRRIRSVDDASPETLRALGRELGAQGFVTLTLHAVELRATPRVSASARLYDATDGELDRIAFASASGLDGRKLLGLGVIDDPVAVAAEVGGRLLAGLDGTRAPRKAPAGLGTIAVVPFAAVSDTEATAAAQTASEIARAVLYRDGVPLVSPNRVAQVLRERRLHAWGGVEDDVREGLAAAGASAVLVGSVEAWDVAGDGFEPEPKVAVALRLVDAATGRILWTGALERRGWDHQGLFRLGRVYDRGTLTERMIERLIESWASRSGRDVAGPRERTR